MWFVPLIAAAIQAGVTYFQNKSNKTQAEDIYNKQKADAKEQFDYQQSKQLDMWNKTNYPQQVEQIKKAGLNPSMLYGSGGGMGTTTGSGTMTLPNHQQTTDSGSAIANAISGGVGQSLDIALKQAQKNNVQAGTENIKADTRKKEIEANKLEGVDTNKAEQEIENLKQGYDNLRMDYEIKQLDITMKNIQNYEQQQSQADRLQTIENNAKQGVQLLTKMSNEAKESTATL